jgi:N-acetylneuraminate synthase
MNKSITIDGREIGTSYPPYIIAEMSANHNGKIERAFETIDMAKAMGADAIKMQSYTADTITIDCDSDDFQIKGGIWDGYNLYRLYEWAQTPFEWHKPIFDHARKTGITIFSTPFDETAVDLLEDLNAPAYKIASFEAIDLPLIKYVAQTKKPVIISTGMANLEEISDAVKTARDNGCEQLALLHCISSYPAPIEQSNLLTIPDLQEQFDVTTGLSDHSMGTTVSVASIALGASIIEKHVTLSRRDKGPDSEFSLEPDELKRLCEETKDAWRALGQGSYRLKSAEQESLKYRRSIYVVEDMKAGDLLSSKNMRRIRPGYGLAPKHYDELLGKKINQDVKRGTPMSMELTD